MRHFTNKERAIINNICIGASRSQDYLPINILAEFFNNPQSGVGCDFNGGVLFFDGTKYPNPEETVKVETEIVEIVLLIKYLIDNNYIYVQHKPNIQFSAPQLGALQSPVQVGLPRDIAFVLSEMRYPVLVLQKLKDLVANDFKTFEELELAESKKQTKEAREQRKAAWWAVGTSGFAIIVAIIMPFIITRCNKDKEKNEAVERTMGTIDNVIAPASQHLSNNVDTIKCNTDMLKQQHDSIVRISTKKVSKKKSNTNNEK